MHDLYLITRRSQARKYNAGFTLLELLIGIALSGMIFIAASSVIMLLVTSNQRVKQRDELEQAKNDISQQISNAVRWAKTVEIDNPPGTLKITDFSTPSVVTEYTLDAVTGKITRNGAPITAENVQVTNFTFADFSVDPNLKSLEIEIWMEHRQFHTVKDTFKVIVTQRNSEFGST